MAPSCTPSIGFTDESEFLCKKLDRRKRNAKIPLTHGFFNLILSAMTREQFEEALQPALFKRLRKYAERIVGERLADDAVQEALGTFKYQNFNPAGAASLSTFLITRVKQRALNLLDTDGPLHSCSFQDSNDTGVLSYELSGELSQDLEESFWDFGPIAHENTDDEAFDEYTKEGNTAESDDEEIDDLPVDIIPGLDMPPEIEAVYLDMAKAGVERGRYHDAHPWARREYLKDKQPLTMAESEQLSPIWTHKGSSG
jgi:DNA-directed RNA polymerase specialized sigma24 family protein